MTRNFGVPPRPANLNWMRDERLYIPTTAPKRPRDVVNFGLLVCAMLSLALAGLVAASMIWGR